MIVAAVAYSATIAGSDYRGDGKLATRAVCAFRPRALSASPAISWLTGRSSPETESLDADGAALPVAVEETPFVRVRATSSR